MPDGQELSKELELIGVILLISVIALCGLWSGRQVRVDSELVLEHRLRVIGRLVNRTNGLLPSDLIWTVC